MGLGQSLTEALLLQGMALLKAAQPGQARLALQEACAAAEALGSSLLLWQSCAALAEAEPNSQESAAWRARAGQTAHFIAEHIRDAGLRASFMELLKARTVL